MTRYNAKFAKHKSAKFHLCPGAPRCTMPEPVLYLMYFKPFLLNQGGQMLVNGESMWTSTG